MKYRKLTNGERIKKDDEYFVSGLWKPMTLFIGDIFKISEWDKKGVRRPITPKKASKNDHK